jgi:hypothetical protein
VCGLRPGERSVLFNSTPRGTLSSTEDTPFCAAWSPVQFNSPPPPVYHHLSLWVFFFFFFFFFCLLWLNVLPACIDVCHKATWRPEEGFSFPGTEVTDGCEPLCVCWESNLDLGKMVLLATEVPLQSLVDCLRQGLCSPGWP